MAPLSTAPFLVALAALSVACVRPAADPSDASPYPPGYAASALASAPPPTDDTLACLEGPLSACATACRRGDASSCDRLGERVCSEGSVVECQASCEAGNITACEALGGMLESGDRVPHDEARAKTLLVRACDRGRAAACTRVGEDILDRTLAADTPTDGVSWLHRACALDAGECTALSVYATSDDEKRFAYERECQAMPTFGDACGRLKDMPLPAGAVR